MNGPLAVSALLDRLGTWGLVRVAVVLVLFVIAQLCRLPLLWTVRVLTAAMCRADRYLTGVLAAAASTGIPSPSVSPSWSSRPSSAWIGGH